MTRVRRPGSTALWVVVALLAAGLAFGVGVTVWRISKEDAKERAKVDNRNELRRLKEEWFRHDSAMLQRQAAIKKSMGDQWPQSLEDQDAIYEKDAEWQAASSLRDKADRDSSTLKRDIPELR